MAIFNKEYLKSLNEHVVYKNPNKDKYFISIDFSTGYGKALALDPYFKVYKGKSYTQSDEDVRFYLKDGHSDKHDDGKKLLKVNDRLLDDISRMLRSKTTDNRYGDISTYDAIWKVIENYAKTNNCKSLEYVPIDIFLEMMYDKNKRK